MENKKSEFKNTLSLISVMRYSRTYQELKEKYKEMVKVIVVGSLGISAIPSFD